MDPQLRVDTVVIKNITDFEAYWPPQSIQYAANEWHGPCPWCGEAGNGGDVVVYNGVKFAGEDRLVFRLHDNTFYCRVCQRNGTGHNGNHFASEAADLFGIIIDEESLEVVAVKEDRPPDLWSYGRVMLSHAQVEREYWHNFGWSDEIIDRFLLGLGTIYPEDGPVHIIPMMVRTAEEPARRGQYAVEGRAPGIRTKRSAGVTRKFFWHIDGIDRDTVVVVEGGKDAITAAALKLGDVMCIFGTNQVSKEKIKFLKDCGYSRVLAFGDNDDAGKHFNTVISAWARELGMADWVLEWGEDFQQGFDLTDLLQTHGESFTKMYVDTHLLQLDLDDQVGVTKARYIDNYAEEVDGTYVPASVDEAIPLEEVRGDGPRSINHALDSFLNWYSTNERRGRGYIKLLKAPPGAGKTHQLVRLAEKLATRRLELAHKRRVQLINDIARVRAQIANGDYEDKDEKEVLEKTLSGMERQLQNVSNTSVMWVTPFKGGYNDVKAAGANPNLWYNYEARDEDNCQNFELVQVLGKNHHDIGGFCKAFCRFRQQCEEEGYLSQEARRKSLPITVFRHQHLVGDMHKDYLDLIVIDESPLHVIEEPMEVRVSQLRPHVETWEMDAGDGREVEAIKIFIKALKQTIVSNDGETQYLSNHEPNPRYVISGAAFLKLLDEQVRNLTDAKESLSSIMRWIDRQTLELAYQPPHRDNDIATVQPRVVPPLFGVIKDELDDYLVDNDHKKPSSLHLVSGVLEVYLMEKIKIRTRTPIVIADATAYIPELYSAMFDRELVDTYAPDIYNPNAKTTVIYGSDFTIGNIERALGRELKDRERRHTGKVQTVYGEEFDLDEIPYNFPYANNKLFMEYVDICRTMYERHSSTLVLVPKKIRGMLEDYVEKNFPEWLDKLVFDHYGNVRGTNKYKDREAVALIGQYRMPYSILWRRVQAWARLIGIVEPIPYQMIYKGKPYHTRVDGHSYRTFTDEFAQRFVDFVEEGEMIQAAERIRPHATNEQKFVYLFASRPSLNFVSETVKKSEFFASIRKNSPVNLVKSLLIQKVRAGEQIPTRNEIMDMFGCGSKTYREAKAAAEAELGMKIPRGKKR